MATVTYTLLILGKVHHQYLLYSVYCSVSLVFTCSIVAASSSLDSHIKLWDLDAGKQIRTLDAGPGSSDI